MPIALSRRLGSIAASLLVTLALATPAAAQVLRAEVGVDGMT